MRRSLLAALVLFHVRVGELRWGNEGLLDGSWVCPPEEVQVTA